MFHMRKAEFYFHVELNLQWQPSTHVARIFDLQQGYQVAAKLEGHGRRHHWETRDSDWS